MLRQPLGRRVRDGGADSALRAPTAANCQPGSCGSRESGPVVMLDDLVGDPDVITPDDQNVRLVTRHVSVLLDRPIAALARATFNTSTQGATRYQKPGNAQTDNKHPLRKHIWHYLHTGAAHAQATAGRVNRALAGLARWDGADRVAVTAGTAAEPSPTRPAEYALLGVAEFSGQVRQADVGIAEVAFGGFSAHVIDECSEGGLLRGESAVQCL